MTMSLFVNFLVLVACSSSEDACSTDGSCSKDASSLLQIGTMQDIVKQEGEDSSLVKDYAWIPIQMEPCTTKCNAYVSAALGKDDPDWGTSPSKPFKTLQYAIDKQSVGQTINLMEGTYRNAKFGQGAANDLVANLQNVKDLTIKNYADHKPKIEFDSSGGISGRNVERVRFIGLEIAGVNADVSYQEAMAGRLKKASKFIGRGIAIWGGHHIQFQNMKVHHCPGSGLRVNGGDYVVLSDSEVYGNCWWSSSAESAIVFAESKSVDNKDDVKMVMRRNEVYDNMNKVPYYNPKYAWNKSPIGSGQNCNAKACNPSSSSFDQKICPWQCQYGKSYQDFIVDGMGVYVTRNNLAGKSYTHGRMELTGNKAYHNGINGLVFHRTDRGIITQNLVYDNGMVPRSDQERTEDWQKDLGKKSGKTGRQPFAGITINNAHDVKMAGNLVSAPSDDDNAYTMEYDAGKSVQKLSSDSKWNKVCQGKYFDESLGPASMFVKPAKCTENAASGWTKTCQTWSWAIANRCQKSSRWVDENYCQRSCYLAGNAYTNADNRCCLPY